MFSNRTLLENIKAADDPIVGYSSGGANHWRTAETLMNIRDVYLH